LTVFIFNCPLPDGGPPEVSDYFWPKRLGGTGSKQAMDIVRDHAGNIIVTGHVEGDADLNGDGDASDTNESGAGFAGDDIFISVINE